MGMVPFFLVCPQLWSQDEQIQHDVDFLAKTIDLDNPFSDLILLLITYDKIKATIEKIMC